MSEKKQAELDILGEAHLPADLLTPTLGSNYGLDGYPDMEYGMGVLEGVLDPELMPAPALPTGLSKSGAGEGMDLTMMMEDSLADLDWLDPTQLQDPERLPERPISIPELEEAWGVNRRTDGVHVFASRDLARAQYEESLTKEATPKKANPKSLMRVIRRAMQRSAAGHDIEALLKEAVLHLGPHLKEASNALLLVKDEHGLAGNVFIRAAAYPGYAQGKHRGLAKTSARYVVVDEKTLKSATWIQNGRCTYTKKIAVTEVPWKSAYKHYEPRLAGRIATTGEPRELLKAAFLTNPNREATEGDPHYRPAHDESLREGFLAEPTKERTVYDRQASRVSQGLRKVAEAIKRGTHGEDLKNLIKISFRNEDMGLAVKKLTPILKKTGALDRGPAPTAAYAGSEFQAHSMHRMASLGESKKVMSRVASGALRWIRQSMSEGFAGRDLTSLIKNRFAGEVRGEIEEPLRELRAAHEGASGFVYVDASAYATSTGVAGCEKGALKHRANQIPAVASMDRCATCTLARDLPDGTRKCATYNKALLDDTSGPELERMKRANIRVANMDDAEQLAALFMTPQNAYDPEEFELRNDNLELDDVEVDFPENPDMADITFGGWDF